MIRRKLLYSYRGARNAIIRKLKTFRFKLRGYWAYYAYIAHPFETHNSKAESRILIQTARRNMIAVNPFDKEGEPGWGYYENPTLDKAEFIFRKDLEVIDSCQALVAYVPPEYSGTGTKMEIMYGWLTGKYIIIVMKGTDGNKKRPFHPFLYLVADEYYTSIKDFEEGKQSILE